MPQTARSSTPPTSSAAQDDQESQASARTSRAMQMLEEAVEQITDSESFKRYLDFSRAFHNYSTNNLLLIFLQKPDATRVAGYKRWKSLGRQVTKGEKAIRILAPVVRKQTDAETGEEVRRVVSFRDASVFDVSQTSGDPLPSAPPLGGVEGSSQNAAALHAALSKVCAEEGVGLSEDDLSQFGPANEILRGYHDPLNSRIVISTHNSPIRKATTLCHELVHYMLHGLHSGLDTDTKETEAEGASYAICSHFGLDTSAFSFPYVATHAQSPEVLRAALDRIQKVVHRALEAAENAQAEGANTDLPESA